LAEEEEGRTDEEDGEASQRDINADLPALVSVSPSSSSSSSLDAGAPSNTLETDPHTPFVAPAASIDSSSTASASASTLATVTSTSLPPSRDAPHPHSLLPAKRAGMRSSLVSEGSSLDSRFDQINSTLRILASIGKDEERGGTSEGNELRREGLKPGAADAVFKVLCSWWDYVGRSSGEGQQEGGEWDVLPCEAGARAFDSPSSFPSQC
jgi:hypothetical protein